MAVNGPTGSRSTTALQGAREVKSQPTVQQQPPPEQQTPVKKGWGVTGAQQKKAVPEQYVEPRTLQNPHPAQTTALGNVASWLTRGSADTRSSMVDTQFRHAMKRSYGDGGGNVTGKELREAIDIARSREGGFDPQVSDRVIQWLKVSPLDASGVQARNEFESQLKAAGQLSGTLSNLPLTGGKTSDIDQHFLDVMQTGTANTSPTLFPDNVNKGIELAKGSDGKIGTAEQSHLKAWFDLIRQSPSGTKAIAKAGF